MAHMAENIRTLLSTSSDVTAVVGSSNSARIHYNHVPVDPARPYIWFQRSGHNEPLALDGVGGVYQEQYSVECWADTPSSAIDLADRVGRTLHGHTGTIGTANARGVFVEDVDDSYVPKGNESDDGVDLAALDVTVWFST